MLLLLAKSIYDLQSLPSKVLLVRSQQGTPARSSWESFSQPSVLRNGHVTLQEAAPKEEDRSRSQACRSITIPKLTLVFMWLFHHKWCLNRDSLNEQGQKKMNEQGPANRTGTKPKMNEQGQANRIGTGTLITSRR